MSRLITLSMVLLAVLAVNGCKKEPAETPAPTTPEATESVAQEPQSEKSEAATPAKETSEKMVPIPLELPKPMFAGTPENLSGIENLEPDRKKPRDPFLAPEGVTNVALNKPVTSSEMDPFIGTLDMIVDGDKEAPGSSVVELGIFEQWVMIDLQKEYDLYAIVLWHYHETARVYKDVVVQVSNDPEFITGVTTLFNNDTDNSLKLGVGTDQNYIDKAEGKLIDAKGVKARYVKLWSQGNNSNDCSHYIEVEVYGK